ncbi:hypothetical protein CAPTEDRAFT_203653 [Capitella teleta]|uniref:P2X purinoreceptor 7 intracellular domain-containing protein n=1 Tax=Capitella teleta TaxID=283909 RepID=R7T4Y9_CAPTE|nr:hypothetical protein CAPTEDRAFT_203653 [Capitella teleta]|eukprot:ELT88068.1 hypothetical protein CAPTEDRAFT_203653 [Capitella teleta]
MACGREERSDCCDSKTKSDQYGECIDESFEYTRNEEENDCTRYAGTEYGGANVDNANQWIVHWNPVKSKLNEMRPDPPACIAHTSMFADLCLKLHVLEVAHVYYRTQCGNLPESRINERYRYVAYRQFVMWIMDILPTWKKYSCTAVIFRETFPSPGYCGFKCPALD